MRCLPPASLRSYRGKEAIIWESPSRGPSPSPASRATVMRCQIAGASQGRREGGARIINVPVVRLASESRCLPPAIYADDHRRSNVMFGLAPLQRLLSLLDPLPSLCALFPSIARRNNSRIIAKMKRRMREGGTRSGKRETHTKTEGGRGRGSGEELRSRGENFGLSLPLARLLPSFPSSLPSRRHCRAGECTFSAVQITARHFLQILPRAPIITAATAAAAARGKGWEMRRAAKKTQTKCTAERESERIFVLSVKWQRDRKDDGSEA